MQQQLTYQPRTREGQRIVEVIETPGRIVNQAADAVGNAITNAGIRSGHPKAGATIGTVAKTAIAAGVGYLLPKGAVATARSVRSMERPTAPPPPSLRTAGSVQNRTALVQNPQARTPLVQNPPHPVIPQGRVAPTSPPHVQTPTLSAAHQALINRGLPKHHTELLKWGYRDITHPEAREAGHITYHHKKTGDIVRFDYGKPG